MKSWEQRGKAEDGYVIDDNAGHWGWRGWEYRVFSELWMCPDDKEYGHRVLSIRRVWWAEYPRDYPTPDDIFAIDDEEVTVEAFSIEEAEVCIERMRRALDKPALIWAEFKHRQTRPMRAVKKRKTTEQPAVKEPEGEH